MQSVTALRRGNISDDLVEALRIMIVDGALAPGERINEVQLAEKLAVSRTPLREALTRLASEGTLRNMPRIGWFVKPLTLEEFDHLYAIRPLLEPEALHLAGLPSWDRLDELEEFNRRILAADDADKLIALDDDFHLLLIADCPNLVLIELIRDFIRRTRRYEIALMRDQKNIATAVDHHREIMTALKCRDLEAGVAALKINLQSGNEPIRAWLKTREESE